MPGARLGILSNVTGVDLPASTLEPVESRHADRVGVWIRRLLALLLTVLVGLGLAGYLGVRVEVTRAEEAGYELELRHASIARAGIDVPWEVTLRSEDGFGPEVQLAVTGDYFAIYETQGFMPEPTEVTRDDDLLLLTFAAPPGDTLVVAYDAYIQPASQVGRGGTLSVVAEGQRLAELAFRTRLLP